MRSSCCTRRRRGGSRSRAWPSRWRTAGDSSTRYTFAADMRDTRDCTWAGGGKSSSARSRGEGARGGEWLAREGAASGGGVASYGSAIVSGWRGGCEMRDGSEDRLWPCIAQRMCGMHGKHESWAFQPYPMHAMYLRRLVCTAEKWSDAA